MLRLGLSWEAALAAYRTPAADGPGDLLYSQAPYCVDVYIIIVLCLFNYMSSPSPPPPSPAQKRTGRPATCTMRGAAAFCARGR